MDHIAWWGWLLAGIALGMTLTNIQWTLRTRR